MIERAYAAPQFSTRSASSTRLPSLLKWGWQRAGVEVYFAPHSIFSLDYEPFVARERLFLGAGRASIY